MNHTTNIGPMLLDIARPDGPNARLSVLLAAIENAHLRLLRASNGSFTPSQVSGIALEEWGKIFTAKAAFDEARGIG